MNRTLSEVPSSHREGITRGERYEHDKNECPTVYRKAYGEEITYVKSVSILDPSESGRSRIESGIRLWGSRLVTGRVFSIALVCMAVSGSIHCGAQEEQIETLDTAAVVGQQEKAKPQAGGFNPMHGRYWLGGYKKSFTSEIPEELRNVDAVTAEPVAIVHRVEASRRPLSTDDDLTRAGKPGRLVACADVWYYPFSERIAKGGNRGIDFDILQEIASRQDWPVEVVLANTGSFGGIGREFRRGIDKGYCDFFTGLLVTGNDYLVLGAGRRLRMRMKALARVVTELNVASRLTGRAAGVMGVPGYVPPKGQRWNGAWGIPKKEPELKRFPDEQFEALLKDAEIKRIVESHGMPFYPPFDQ